MANAKVKSRNRANVGLVIALCIVSACLIVTSILWLTNLSKMNNMG